MFNLRPLKKNDFISCLLRVVFWKAAHSCNTTSLANTRLLPGPMFYHPARPPGSLVVNEMKSAFPSSCPTQMMTHSE